MATKRKTSQKSSKPKKKAPKKKVGKRPALKTARKKVATKTKSVAKKAASRVKSAVASNPPQRKGPGRVGSPGRGVRGPASGGQSGDLQGLSGKQRANTESVDELLEEGNSFEAAVVSGVEDADEHEGAEVHTHEVPEDDVPGEYLDED